MDLHEFAAILDSLAGDELVAVRMCGLGVRDCALWSFASGASITVRSATPGDLDDIRTAVRYSLIVADVTCVAAGVRVVFCGGHPGLEPVTVIVEVVPVDVAGGVAVSGDSVTN